MNEERERAQSIALSALSRRSMTCRQMRDKLKDKEVPPELAEEIIDYLCECGYLDDAEYARIFIIDSVKIKGRGRRRILEELRQKGISRDVAERIYDEAEPDEESAVRRLLEQKSAGRNMQDRRERDKVIQFLLRRGFSFDVILRVLEDIGVEDDL